MDSKRIKSFMNNTAANLLVSAKYYRSHGLETQAQFFERYALAIQEKYNGRLDHKVTERVRQAEKGSLSEDTETERLGVYRSFVATLDLTEPTHKKQKVGPVIVAFLIGGAVVTLFSIFLTILSNEIVLLHPHVAIFLLIGIIGLIAEILVAKSTPREQ